LKSLRQIDIVISRRVDIMAQFVVRQLEEEVKARLQRRAERHGRSMEAEVREILRDAAKDEGRPATKLGSRIARRFRGQGLPSDLPELRGQRAKPAGLDR
jgi:plasmid stability protein